jgi:hypothetical protein
VVKIKCLGSVMTGCWPRRFQTTSPPNCSLILSYLVAVKKEGWKYPYKK